MLTMPERLWREFAHATFDCEKRPATGSRGMVVTNHPLASAAGAEMMAPAIKHATQGFQVTPYLYECIADAASDLSRDAAISSIFM
jgi:gamma-glutamyltranspeptidase